MAAAGRIGLTSTAAVLAFLLVAGLLGGCAGREAAPTVPDPYFEGGPPVPPLRGEGFPFGRPPELEVTVEARRAAAVGRSLPALLAAWTWPADPNRTVMADVGWPPPLPPSSSVSLGDRLRLRVPGVTFRPSAAQLLVVSRSHYAGGTAPRGAPAPVLEISLDGEHGVRVDRSGVAAEWVVGGVPPGEWVLVYRFRWDAPIGGEATYLVPVRLR